MLLFLGEFYLFTTSLIREIAPLEPCIEKIRQLSELCTYVVMYIWYIGMHQQEFIIIIDFSCITFAYFVIVHLH